jgi:hypothetical protein
MMAMTSVRLLLMAAVLGASMPAPGRPLTLTPVGNPIPGVGPVGIAVAETSGGTYALIGDYQGNTVRSLRLDPATGTLSAVGSVPVTDGPSAIAAYRTGHLFVVSNLRSNNVTSLRLDPATGTLSAVGSVPSGGTGPSAIAINHDGVVVVANRDSNNVGVLRLDPATGTLSAVGSVTVGTGPAAVKISGNVVAVGHAVSNDVHLLHLDRHGALSTIDTRSVGARVTWLHLDAVPAIGARHSGSPTQARLEYRVAASTYPNGDVHTFIAEPARLTPLGAHATGGDIISIALQGYDLFVAGLQPGRLSAFDYTSPVLPQTGTLPLSGQSSRTIATVKGPGDTTYVIVNEYNNNRTLSVRASP